MSKPLVIPWSVHDQIKSINPDGGAITIQQLEVAVRRAKIKEKEKKSSRAAILVFLKKGVSECEIAEYLNVSRRHVRMVFNDYMRSRYKERMKSAARKSASGKASLIDCQTPTLSARI